MGLGLLELIVVEVVMAAVVEFFHGVGPHYHRLIPHRLAVVVVAVVVMMMVLRQQSCHWLFHMMSS